MTRGLSGFLLNCCNGWLCRAKLHPVNIKMEHLHVCYGQVAVDSRTVAIEQDASESGYYG